MALPKRLDPQSIQLSQLGTFRRCPGKYSIPSMSNFPAFVSVNGVLARSWSCPCSTHMFSHIKTSTVRCLPSRCSPLASLPSSSSFKMSPFCHRYRSPPCPPFAWWVPGPRGPGSLTRCIPTSLSKSLRLRGGLAEERWLGAWTWRWVRLFVPGLTLVAG